MKRDAVGSQKLFGQTADFMGKRAFLGKAHSSQLTAHRVYALLVQVVGLENARWTLPKGLRRHDGEVSTICSSTWLNSGDQTVAIRGSTARYLSRY